MRETWSGKRDSNPRPPAWKAGALPLSYSRLKAEPRAPFSSAEPYTPFSSAGSRGPHAVAPLSAHPRSAPASRHSLQWWGGEDLNPRRRTPADLQSAPFGHLGTSPNPPARTWQLLEKAGAGGRI